MSNPTFTPDILSKDSSSLTLSWTDSNVSFSSSDSFGLYINDINVATVNGSDNDTITFTGFSLANYGDINGNTFYAIKVVGPSYDQTASEQVYVASPIGAITTFDVEPACYLEDTDILCFNEKTQSDEYKKVQELKRGDLVKTKYHGYKKLVKLYCQTLPVYKNTFSSSIYKLSKHKNPNLTKDLFITGGHSIAVDCLSPQEEEKQFQIWQEPQMIDDKQLLLAGCGDDFVKMVKKRTYQSYHFTLEPNETNNRYLVWANGILSESTTLLAFQNH